YGEMSGSLVCHHCAYATSFTQECPSCHGPFLKQLGAGTQRIEHEVRELFPESKIVRMDSDVTNKRGAHQEIFDKFASGEANILIGTQMIAKGLDVAKVTVVGVLAADAAFNLPDYRSMERGFQLLTQVAGRAGRGHDPGSVVLQTFNTELPALHLACSHNY